jgi:16S rRNA (cytosine1402-N4)-methyltransferase
LCQEVIQGLGITPQGIYLDATLGLGGHTLALLESGARYLVGIDQDPEALRLAQTRIDTWIQSQSFGPQPNRQPPQVVLHHLNFSQISLLHHGLRDALGSPLPFHGILADLGVSSFQLDTAERGFSFRSEGPLDMRMDPTTARTAAEWINQADAETLVSVFSDYGEERYSRRIARHIVQNRPLSSTTQLAEVIQAAVPASARFGRIHPATRVFQALRIVVNQEMTALEQFLKNVPEWLAPGGKVAIISFHSLEDRLVKHAFRRDPRLRVITPKPIQPQSLEIRENPRSRSAKLRIAVRVEDQIDLT